MVAGRARANPAADPVYIHDQKDGQIMVGVVRILYGSVCIRTHLYQAAGHSYCHCAVLGAQIAHVP